MQITILQNEVWYGLCTQAGVNLPFDENSVYNVNLDPNFTGNQVSPLLLSSKGRYVWGDITRCTVENGVITIETKGEPVLEQGGSTLKEAYLSASRQFFPPSGKMPPDVFFAKPQYNTWIELMYNQNELDIKNYAKAIIDNGLPAGVFMIDDIWSDYYGKWEFNHQRFPNPKEMVAYLHELGFFVMLWICPFVTPDTIEFRYLRDKNMLVKNSDGKAKLVDWWNGYSAVLDLSNPETEAWLKEKCDFLVNELGIDGFKFDAGDGIFYSDNDITYGNVSSNTQASLWNKFGLYYPYNEFRACYQHANQPLVQRLADKNHRWDNLGVSSLIPNSLAQGMLGYSYTCPDMIGGGSFADFLPDAVSFDSELMLRFCAASALLPMMQFSAAPWRLLSQENFEGCKRLIELHSKFSDEILSLARHSAETGEPIIRYLEYVFPHQGLEHIRTEFMLGDNILVAPVTEKGASEREVVLPSGKWAAFDGNVFDGGQTVVVKVSRYDLPYFKKITQLQ